MKGEQTFTVRIQMHGARSFLPIPFDPDEAWGAKARHHVTGTVAGYAVRAEIGRYGDQIGIPLGPAWLRDNPLPDDEPVEALLRPEGAQSGSVAADLAAAFQAEQEAAAFFDGLPTFYRNNFMRWIDGAKRPETRAARIRESIQLLREGKRERSA